MQTERILEGHYALVTGGSRGIGRAIAEGLAEAGCHVAIASRTSGEPEQVAETIASRCNVRAAGFQTDVSLRTSVASLFQDLADWSGARLDVLVNNAGYPFRPEIWNSPLHLTAADLLEPWYLDVFKTDTLGSVYCTHEALTWMIPQQRGSIIYISSTPALAGLRGTPYTVAKAGVLGLMKDVALEYGRYNIRANALVLGNIGTPATIESLNQATYEELAHEAPLCRWGRPEEVADAAVFLAGHRSSFITGQTLVLDGGTYRR